MRELVDRIVSQIAADPIGAWTGSEDEKLLEQRYLGALHDTYIRTLDDIDNYFRSARRPPSDIRIIEFGTYMGVVSKALSELGYQVTASDFPKLLNNERVRHAFAQARVAVHPQDLACRMETLDDASFDGVIICETLEHLPFNPLPVLDELNRILKPGGLLYISVPNIASFRNRALLLFGKSIHNPIADFFEQVRPNCLMTVGLHWREYTKNEMETMLSGMGFQICQSKYFDYSAATRSALHRLAKRTVLGFLPGLSATVVVMAKKAVRSDPTHASNIGRGTVDVAP